MPSNWLPLPTHEGWWWRRHDGLDVPILVGFVGASFFEYQLYFSGRALTQYVDPSIEFSPVLSPPPADNEPLPRRFRWKGMNCVQWPSGEIDCEDGDVYMHIPMLAEQWLAERADEIEWID